MHTEKFKEIYFRNINAMYQSLIKEGVENFLEYNTDDNSQTYLRVVLDLPVDASKRAMRNRLIELMGLNDLQGDFERASKGWHN